MSSDLKRQHERARCDILLRRLNITASFVRPGNDQGEPDMISTIPPACQRRRTEARDGVEGALLENEMEFASNAEYDAQRAQFYSITILPGAVDNYQAKLFGWNASRPKRELGVGNVSPTTSDYE